MSVQGWSSSNYFSRSGAVVTTTPLTIACWFNAANATTSGWLVSLGNNGGSGFFGLMNAGATAGDPIRAQAQNDGGTSGIADSSTGFTASIWQHAAAVFASTTSRTAYSNGGGAITDTTSISDPTPDFTTLGVLRRAAIASPLAAGTLVAEVGIWNAALTADEIASLASGANPLMIRPASLVAYYPCFDATTPNPEWMAAAELTMTGTITAGDNPPVFRYSDSHGLFVPAAGGGGSVFVPYYYQLLAGSAA